MATTPTLLPSVKTELPGPLTRAQISRGQFDMQSIYRSVVMDDERSLGPWLVDIDGNVFLDLFANFALGALGYNHPALMAVTSSPGFARAAANPTSTPFLTTPGWFDFVEAIEAKFAPKGMSRMFCVDGGGEGVEAAIKAAFIVQGERIRAARGEPRNPLLLSAEAQSAWMDNKGTDVVVVSFAGAFHGRGLGPMSATHSKLIHKADLPAFPWPTAPFPVSRFPLERYAEENAAAEAECLRVLERILNQYQNQVAAILIEPIQGEGGDRHASPHFYQSVQYLAGKAGAAFIMDEVQAGMGISGTLWTHEQLNLPQSPDLMAFGKKMQFGGFFATPDFDITQFGRMYQTRNGDRARAMVGLATLETIERDQLLNNVRETGAYFLHRLWELANSYPSLVEQPRGRGFILAFDLPTTSLRDDFLKRALHKGVFATYTGTRSVRLRPHLITTPAEVDIAMDVFHQVLKEMV